jgi:hypothetical protein
MPCGLQSASRVCGLQLSGYGLSIEQVSIWFEAGSSGMYSRFATFLLTLGFVEAKYDTSLFIYHHDDGVAYLLLYDDDIVPAASNPQLLQRIITSLQQEFAMKDLGQLHHFLGVTVEPR